MNLARCRPNSLMKAWRISGAYATSLQQAPRLPLSAKLSRSFRRFMNSSVQYWPTMKSRSLPVLCCLLGQVSRRPSRLWAATITSWIFFSSGAPAASFSLRAWPGNSSAKDLTNLGRSLKDHTSAAEHPVSARSHRCWISPPAGPSWP